MNGFQYCPEQLMFTVAVAVALWTTADAADKQLTDAVAQGDKNQVKRLLRNGVGPNDASQIPDEGYTPLHIAVGEDRVDIADLLVRAGAKLEAKDLDGRTALHRATWIGSVESTKWLLGQGADVLAMDKQGKTPIDLALEHNYAPVVKVIEEFLESS